MHNISCKSALARRVCRYSDARPPRKTDGVLLESEIPPRMRGKANQPQKGGAAMRITPAYAGKSFCISLQVHYGWDHPRICGEKPAGEEPTFCPKGSPPRMRGKVKRQQATAPPGQDHPCVCGEKYRMKPNRVCGLGSPPRMRGKGRTDRAHLRLLGITPAYAGKRRSGPPR